MARFKQGLYFKKPRAVQRNGKMNRLETAYAAHLDFMKELGMIEVWKFEPIKFRLAAKTFYTPDFMVTTLDEVQFHEVKGFWEDDARVKIKVVSELYPQFRFSAFSLVAKKKVAGIFLPWESDLDAPYQERQIGQIHYVRTKSGCWKEETF